MLGDGDTQGNKTDKASHGDKIQVLESLVLTQLCALKEVT